MSAPEERRAVAAYQAQQRVVSSSLIRDIARLLKLLLDLGQPEKSWPGVRMATGAMILTSRQQSASLAGRYYQQMRTAAGVPGLIVPAPPRDLTEDRLEAALDSAGPAVLKRSLRLGATPAQARDRMAVTLSGTASRLALEGGRDVMEATTYSDQDALGWARVGDGDSCSWCLMLISRGNVYESARAAGDVRYGGAQYHDHDGCQAVPVFDLESPVLERAEELYDLWKQITAGHSGADARTVWRRHWEADDPPKQP